jgi:hypothetical protein
LAVQEKRVENFGADLYFGFRLIAAHVAELTRPFDEVALPLSALLNGRGLVAERVNRSSGQLRGLASASSFRGRR